MTIRLTPAAVGEGLVVRKVMRHMSPVARVGSPVVAGLELVSPVGIVTPGVVALVVVGIVVGLMIVVVVVASGAAIPTITPPLPPPPQATEEPVSLTLTRLQLHQLGRPGFEGDFF
jgi:hypothetical protein